VVGVGAAAGSVVCVTASDVVVTCASCLPEPGRASTA